MSFKVAQLFELPGLPDYDQMFKEAGLKIEVVKKHCMTEDEILATAHDADAVIGVATFQPFSKRVIEGLTNCRFIISMGIGYDYLDVQAATDHSILTANVPDYCLEEVSDHTMALILACARKITKLNDTVKGGGWKAMIEPSIQTGIWPKMSRLRGQTLGLIGFGRIPRTLIPKAKGFGLKIIAYDPYVAANLFAELGVEKVELDQLLKDSDIVSVHSAFTSETQHMLGLNEFKKMKPSAILINTARGTILDQQALYTALKDGIITAAAVDVTEPEPINTDDPLLKLDNYIVTAHSAHFSPTAFMEMVRRPAEEIIKIYRGEWPRIMLNPEVKEKYSKKWGQVSS